MLINTNRYLCRDCANRGTLPNGSPACALSQKPINIDKDFCSQHKINNQNAVCKICGKPQINYIYSFNDKLLLVCENCQKHIGTCGACSHVYDCGFKNDHSEPQYVNKQIRNGIGIIQTQIKNPNLVKKHCSKCHCGCEENCLKDENGENCSSWMPLPELLQ